MSDKKAVVKICCEKTISQQQITWQKKEVIYHRAIKDLVVAKTEATICAEERKVEIDRLNEKIKLAKNRLVSISEMNNSYRENNCFMSRILDQVEKTNNDL